MKIFILAVSGEFKACRDALCSGLSAVVVQGERWGELIQSETNREGRIRGRRRASAFSAYRHTWLHGDRLRFGGNCFHFQETLKLGASYAFVINERNHLGFNVANGVILGEVRVLWMAS
jgi:hypothetical protein